MRLADLERFEPRAVTWFFRLYGLALIANVTLEVRAGTWHVHTGELYPWRHLPIVPLYPAWALAVEWAVTVVAAALVLLERRAGLVLAALVMTASVLQRYSNHGVLLLLIGFFAALEPLPVYSRPDRPSHALGLVRAQLVIVYWFGALNKYTHHFLNGDALAALGFERFARPLSFAVVATEVAIPLLLATAPRIGIPAVILLHLGFSVFLPGLASFGLAMAAMAVLYAPLSSARDSGS